MPEFKSYTKESTSFTPAAGIRRGATKEAQSERMAGDISELDVVDSLRSGIDKTEEQNSKKNFRKSIQLDRKELEATGMDKTVPAIISSEGEVGEEAALDLIIDYNALIARRKAQGLPSLFGDSDTDADSTYLGLRTLLPELREEKFRNRGSKVERELSHGRIINGRVSSESETAEEATNEGFVSHTRNRRMNPSLIINNSTRSPFLASGSDQEALATSTPGTRNIPGNGFGNGNKGNVTVIRGSDDSDQRNEAKGEEHHVKLGGDGNLATTQGGRFTSSSSQTLSSSDSSIATSSIHSTDTTEPNSNDGAMRNDVIEGASSSTEVTIDQNKLTPQERHYLNKALVSLQIQTEFSSLSKIGTLTTYGLPFLPYPNGPNSKPVEIGRSNAGFLMSFLGGGKARKEGWEDYEWNEKEGAQKSPILGYLYWRYINNFPCLREANPEYWEKIQGFFDSFAEHDLSTTRERSEVTKRRLLSFGITRILGSYFGTCMTSLHPSAPARPSKDVMRRIDSLFSGSMESMWNHEFPGTKEGYNAWVGVVSSEDETFMLVSRVEVVKTRPIYLVKRSWTRFQQLQVFLTSIDPTNTLLLRQLPGHSSTTIIPSLKILQKWLRSIVISLSAPSPDLVGSKILLNARKELELLLLDSPEIVSGEELAQAVETVERGDIELEKERTLWVDMGKRCRKLRNSYNSYKGALIDGDEMDKSMALVKKTAKIVQLSESYRITEEFVRIWVAYALHYVLIVHPSGPELVALFKGFHDLMPYAALKLGLSLVNPTLAIRAIVAIMLGQPGGASSLFQTVFSIVIGSGIRAQKKIIEAMRKDLGKETMVDAIRSHAYSHFKQRAATQEASQTTKEDILITIMCDQGTPEDVSIVQKWHSDYASWAGKDALVDQAGNTSGANRFRILRNLLRAFCKKRDREQVLEIVMEHNTPILIKASISVFYSAIYKIANASNLSARLGDLQAFNDDLLSVCLSDKHDASDFIQLTGRHDQKLYFWIHEMTSNGGTLMDPLVNWCKSGLQLIKDGVPPAPTLNSSATPHKSPTTLPKLRRAGVDYDKIIAVTKADTRGAVLEEIRGLALWSSYRKCYADICLRADLLAIDTGMQLDKAELYSELLSQDREALEFIESRREERNDEGEIGWAWFAGDDVLSDISSIRIDSKGAKSVEQKLIASRKGGKRKSENGGAGNAKGKDGIIGLNIPAPRVKVTKELLQHFVICISPCLDSAKASGYR